MSQYPTFGQTETTHNVYNSPWGGNLADVWLQIQLKEMFQDVEAQFKRLVISIYLSKALDVAEIDIEYNFTLTYYYSNSTFSHEWELFNRIIEVGNLEPFEIHFQFEQTLSIDQIKGNYLVNIDVYTHSIYNKEQNKGFTMQHQFEWTSDNNKGYPFSNDSVLETKIWYKTTQFGSTVHPKKEPALDLGIPLELVLGLALFIILVFVVLMRKKITDRS